jgi:hypothetical protein
MAASEGLLVWLKHLRRNVRARHRCVIISRYLPLVGGAQYSRAPVPEPRLNQPGSPSRTRSAWARYFFRKRLALAIALECQGARSEVAVALPLPERSRAADHCW